jgi:type IV pilus assembly protein PilV
MHKNTGFTLIEVLIAMLVLAVGLLGLAGLQATSLRNNQSAYNRGQATQLAYDIADRIRANASVANNYAGSFMKLPDATAQADCLVVSTTCTTADMAENDLYEWNCAVAGGCENDIPPISATLPSGEGIEGTIEEAAGVFTITITWDDNRDGDADGDGSAREGDDDNDGDTDDDPFFQTSFRL